MSFAARMLFRNALLGLGLFIGFQEVAAAEAKPPALSADETYALARDAYLYAYPIVSVDATLRQATNVPDAATVNMRAPVNQFAHARAYPRADEKDVVRFNFDTLYSFAWLDLSGEPVILSVPDTHGRYYLLPMLDMWTDVFSVVGSRTTGTRAGNYGIVPPGWKGTLPDGVVKIVAPTPVIWILCRTGARAIRRRNAWPSIHRSTTGRRRWLRSTISMALPCSRGLRS